MDHGRRHLPARRVAGRVVDRFNKLSPVQVMMVWLAWGLLWWGLFYIGALTGGEAVNVWVVLCLLVAFVGGPVLMALTWVWFGSRRML